MASFQPPAYQAQDWRAPVSRSPIVGIVWLGTSCSAAVVDGCGAFTVNAVLTTYPSGVTAPSLIRPPLASSCATMVDGALGNTGDAAATSQMWLRNEPPKAAWKKLSARVYFLASAAMGRPSVW